MKDQPGKGHQNDPLRWYLPPCKTPRKRGLDPYRGRQWRGGKGREAFIAGTAQDAVIRKCIFSNEVMDGRTEGRSEESRNGGRGKEGTNGREGKREGGRRWLLVWVVNHGAAGPHLLEAGRRGTPPKVA